MNYKIGQVAREIGITEKRIREYEEEGLIKPRRRPSSSQRMYEDFDVRRIKQIKQLIHGRGLTLAGIKTLLALAPCWNVIDCPNYESCPAYSEPRKKCWEIQEDEKVTMECRGNCDRCPVYLLRDFDAQPLFERSAP